MKKSLILVAIVVAVFIFFRKQTVRLITPVSKLTADLVAYVPSFPWSSMTAKEIRDCHTWVFDYVEPGKKDSVPAGLASRINAISKKYNVFT